VPALPAIEEEAMLSCVDGLFATLFDVDALAAAPALLFRLFEAEDAAAPRPAVLPVVPPISLSAIAAAAAEEDAPPSEALTLSLLLL
jgi:hypothetical protein